MARTETILLAPPECAQAAAACPAAVAHLAYRAARGGVLLRAGIPPASPGHMMAIDAKGYTPAAGDGAALCRRILWECAARGYAAIVADWEFSPTPAALALSAALAGGAAEAEIPLYLPEHLARQAGTERVMISSALSGGSFLLRLEEAQARFGRDRAVLALCPCRAEFSLPDPTGRGRSLSPEELREKLERCRPAVFFSRDLCANYFTYRPGPESVSLVLFDNERSLEEKLACARRLGMPAVLMAYPEVKSLLPRLLER